MVLPSARRKVLNGFPPQRYTEVSPTASRMWKWVNRLPSCPSHCFHWSSSSWIITERNNVSSVRAVPRQGSGSRVINVCTHVYFSHFHTAGSIKTQSSRTHAPAQLPCHHILSVLLSTFFPQLFINLAKDPQKLTPGRGMCCWPMETKKEVILHRNSLKHS